MTKDQALAIAKVVAIRRGIGPELAKKYPALAEAIDQLASVNKAATR